MQSAPPFPDGRPTCFRSTVHGTIFAGRDRHIDMVKDGDVLHLGSGDPIGHLPGEIGCWLWPWMLRGGVAEARVLRVGGAEVPSWRRVVLEVVCRIENRSKGR